VSIDLATGKFCFSSEVKVVVVLCHHVHVSVLTVVSLICCIIFINTASLVCFFPLLAGSCFPLGLSVGLFVDEIAQKVVEEFL